MSERNIDMILEGTLPTDSKEAYLKAWDTFRWGWGWEVGAV